MDNGTDPIYIVVFSLQHLGEQYEQVVYAYQRRADAEKQFEKLEIEYGSEDELAVLASDLFEIKLLNSTHPT